MNRLANTKCYLCGPIEYFQDGGIHWRDYVKAAFSYMNIEWLDPCNKPTTFIQETPETNKELCNLRRIGEYDKVAEKMQWVRRVDLRLVHLSDFLIVYLNKDIPTFGTYEEIVWANQEKKPILILYAQGIKEAPLWLFGMIPHKMIFSSWKSMQAYLDHIDGSNYEHVPVDLQLGSDYITPWSDNRWHLFDWHGR